MKGPFCDTVQPLSSLVVLSGLDGSGKSTQTALFAEHLRTEGIRAQSMWNRWEPVLSAPAISLAKRYLRAKGRITVDDYRSFTEAKRQRMKGGWNRRLWQLMVWMEYACQVRWRLLPHRLTGTIVISDRYVYDTLIDIAINFSIPPEGVETLMDHPLLCLFPRPAVAVFIDIDPETGASRKNDGTPAAYLADRREYYTQLSRIMNAPLVDGGGTVETVAARIWELTRDWRSFVQKGPRGHGRNA